MADKTVKLKPEDCLSIDDVREQIDIIDKEIIRLICERALYVKEVVKYKMPDKDSIIAKERYLGVLEERKKWAREQGFNEQVIGKIYQIMMDHFIDEQLKHINLK